MSASTETAETAPVITEEVVEEVVEGQEVAVPEVDPSGEEVVTDEATTSEPVVDEVSVADKKAESRAFFANRMVRKELKEAEARNTALQTKLDERQTETPTEQETELKIEDFAFDDDALNEAKIQREVAKQVKVATQGIQKQAQVDAQEARSADIRRQQDEYGVDNPDYIELANAADETGLVMPQALDEAIMDSKNPVGIHHLVLQDTTLLEKMHTMSPIALIKHVGALEAQVMPEAKKATPKKSNAPKPIQSEVGGGGSPGGDSTDVYDPDISMAEMERRSIAKWKRDNP